MKVQQMPTASLKPYERNARNIPPEAVRKVAAPTLPVIPSRGMNSIDEVAAVGSRVGRRAARSIAVCARITSLWARRIRPRGGCLVQTCGLLPGTAVQARDAVTRPGRPFAPFVGRSCSTMGS